MTTSLRVMFSEYLGMRKWCSFLFVMFIGFFFVDGITRYKHLLFYCSIITCFCILYREKWLLKEIIKNHIFKFLVLLLVVGIYASSISIDSSLSIKYFSNTILEKTIFTPVVYAVVISQLNYKDICRCLLVGLGLMFLVSGGKELYAYYIEYQQGIYPFTNYNHRFIAEALIFSLPCVLFFWKKNGSKAKVIFFIVGFIYTFLMFGLLQRGAWLAILVLSILWCFFNREWKLPLLVAIIITLSGIGLFTTYHERFSLLAYKLEQTSSSHRFGNGTQGAAWDMVMQHPVKGTGIGDKVYLKAYANNVSHHQQWFFRDPIGPHNFFLANWFAGGLLGLFSAVALVLAILVTAWKGYRNTESLEKYCYTTIFLMVFSDFLVRGWVEETFIFQTAIASAFLMGMFLSHRRSLTTDH